MAETFSFLMIDLKKIEKIILNENESTFIPLGALHQLSNPKKSMLKIIEVQSGSLLSEEDI